MEKFIKLAILAFVGIIVGSFAIGLVSGAGIGSQFDQTGILPGVNNASQPNHAGMNMGPGYGPQDPWMQQQMQQHMQYMQQNPNMQMNMQGQMPGMNMQGNMPGMNMQGNMQGQMPGMNMQDNNMMKMNMMDGNMMGMKMDMGMPMM
ncbi:MAG: hypothetical protein M0Z31_11445 [Clostridia bacterium]|nr:hypothetical protein [Clostridia bacterium]